MNLITKVAIQFSALYLAIFYSFVFSADDFSNKCPEFNPQNELDIDLVSLKLKCKVSCITVNC